MVEERTVVDEQDPVPADEAEAPDTDETDDAGEDDGAEVPTPEDAPPA